MFAGFVPSRARWRFLRRDVGPAVERSWQTVGASPLSPAVTCKAAAGAPPSVPSTGGPPPCSPTAAASVAPLPAAAAATAPAGVEPRGGCRSTTASAGAAAAARCPGAAAGFETAPATGEGKHAPYTYPLCHEKPSHPPTGYRPATPAGGRPHPVRGRS